MTTPSTEAGRCLVLDCIGYDNMPPDRIGHITRSILAIEAEAAAAALAALRERVEGLHECCCACPFDGTDPDCYLRLDSAAVLALFDEPKP